MTAYYNEIDPFCAQWLRNLIAAGHIAPGEVDERDIRDVAPADLIGFNQCHFFAGIGIWSHALRQAGWADDRPVWTGSCPCQPFSAAGRGGGVDDERHLWPAFFHLIESRRPDVVFGEQVASKDGLGWSDLVQADCQGAAYAFRAEDICAAGVGAPHIRQRLWFVAFRRRAGELADTMQPGRAERWAGAGGGSAAGGGEPCTLADADGPGRGQLAQPDGEPLARCEEGQLWLDYAGRGDAGLVGDAESLVGQRREPRESGGREVPTGGSGIPLELGDAIGEGPQERSIAAFEPGALRFQGSALGAANPLRGFWRDADWIYCRDGKYRPVEPRAQQMVNGIAAGMGLLCANENLKEEVAHAAKDSGIASQILRAVRHGHGAQEIWFSLGGRLGFSEANILLAFMREHSRELGAFFNCEKKGGPQESSTNMREVREVEASDACSPQGREYTQQLSWELGDLVPKLSQACAHARQSVESLARFNGFPLAMGVPNRVSQLRAYGNAIVPQVAEEVIREFLRLAP